MIPPVSRQLTYLVAAACFILGLKRLSSPATARQGNALSGTRDAPGDRRHPLGPGDRLVRGDHCGWWWGSAIGVFMARSVRMTSMPQMVALLNGFGGGASLVVGGAEFLRSELVGEIPRSTPPSPSSSRC
jgi:H+-translocating NAD(P) transhydrogenase subunit beta